MTVRLLGAALLGATAAGAAAAADRSPLGPTPDAGGPGLGADLGLDRLLDQLGPGAPNTEAGVEVAAWIEQPAGAGASEVVLRLTPMGGAKLVADPGITVSPVEQPGDDGVAWRTPLPYRLVDAGADYFAEPPLIRLPVAGREVGPIDLDVEYAYCVVDYICLFGEERVTAALRPDPAGGGPLSR